jgi:hypothetical protein
MKGMPLAPCTSRSAGDFARAATKRCAQQFAGFPSQPRRRDLRCRLEPTAAHGLVPALQPSGSATRFAGGSTQSQCRAFLLAPCPATAQGIDACAVAQPRCNDLRWRLKPTTIQTTSLAPQSSRSARRCCAYLTPVAAQCNEFMTCCLSFVVFSKTDTAGTSGLEHCPSVASSYLQSRRMVRDVTLHRAQRLRPCFLTCVGLCAFLVADAELVSKSMHQHLQGILANICNEESFPNRDQPMGVICRGHFPSTKKRKAL